MLERFKVKDDHAVRVGPDPLRETVAGIFEKMDVPTDDARLAADVLVTADLRGVDSHGVSNMLRSYVNGYNRGEINPRPQWRVVRQTSAAATVDSDRGLGIIIAPKAMELAMDKADDTGIGMVTMSNGRHMGMASYHAMMALQRDMIGTCMTSAPPRMVPTFGAEPRLGTNPIAVAAPAKEEPPFVYDAATTVVAQNKIVLARRLEAMIPAGLARGPRRHPHPRRVRRHGRRRLAARGQHSRGGLAQRLRTGLCRGYHVRAALRRLLRYVPWPPQLQSHGIRLQDRGVHRHQRVQRSHGPLPPYPTGDPSRTGSRPRTFPRSSRSRGPARSPSQRHPPPR